MINARKFNNLTNEEKEVAQKFFEEYENSYTNIKVSRNECIHHDPTLQQVDVYYVRFGDTVFVAHDRDSLFFRIFGDNQISEEMNNIFLSEYDILTFAFWEDYSNE
jgi:hypothetical protein